MQKITTISEAWEREYPPKAVLAITPNDDGRLNQTACKSRKKL